MLVYSHVPAANFHNDGSVGVSACRWRSGDGTVRDSHGAGWTTVAFGPRDPDDDDAPEAAKRTVHRSRVRWYGYTRCTATATAAAANAV